MDCGLVQMLSMTPWSENWIIEPTMLKKESSFLIVCKQRALTNDSGLNTIFHNKHVLATEILDY